MGLHGTVYTNANDPLDIFASYAWRAARSQHKGGVNALFADGSVWFVKDTIDLTTWRGLATRAGNEALSDY